MIVAFAFMVALSGRPDRAAPRLPHRQEQRAPATARDQWFGTDKLKHYFVSALIQSSAYSVARSADASRSSAGIAASVTSAAFGVAKEVKDHRQGKPFSVKDLVWDGAGALTAAALLNGTR